MLQYRQKAKLAQKLNTRDKTEKRPCNFCDPKFLVEVITENSTMRVARNRVSYDLFEGVEVSDHLMILPKEHRAGFAEFTDQEKIDHLNLAAEFEAKGYNLYTRAPKSKTRSVAHLHSHLLQMKGRRVKALLYLSKPHILIHGKRAVDIIKPLHKRTKG
ncbi:MAG: adenylyltransferase [Patescibacteria group bacterium]|nr:hypothetical protein [Candidatus Saccharibacteria bacterium]MDQ5963421.1 adenylyltransferase [Patescibacteria group bacterium]